MKSNKFLLALAGINLAIFTVTNSKDVHCYIPIVGNTQHCAAQAEIDAQKREARAHATQIKKEAKLEADTTKTEAKERAKQIISGAQTYKKEVENQTKALNPQYADSDRHWYNLWRFWDMQKA